MFLRGDPEKQRPMVHPGRHPDVPILEIEHHFLWRDLDFNTPLALEKLEGSIPLYAR